MKHTIPAVKQLALTTIALLLALGGCSDSSTEPDEMFNLTGTVAKDAAFIHPVELDETVILRIGPTSWIQKLADGTVNNPSTLRPGIALGNLNAGVCTVTSGTFLLSIGETTSFRLSSANYCVQVFDTGVFPTGSTVQYVLLVEIER